MVLNPRWLERRETRIRAADDLRDDGDVDYARVIHSAYFRRLQGKTQILNLGDSDFYRTRLTHSMEVAQIAGGIVLQLERSFPDHPAAAALPGRSLIQAIACAHDLGHPPFGHGGEVALSYCMRDAGGFEGNGQTLRILTSPVETTPQPGLNLCRRSLLGVLKYPAPYSRVANPAMRPALHAGGSVLQTLDRAASKPPKCYLDTEARVVDWVLAPLHHNERVQFAETREIPDDHAKTLHKSLDCSIMDVADDIAYGVHDLEDAIGLKLVTRDAFCRAVPAEISASFGQPHERIVAALFGPSHRRKAMIGALVHHFIASTRLTEDARFETPLLRFRVTLPKGPGTFLGALKKFIFKTVIDSPEVQQLEFKGQAMVVAVFEALQSDPGRLLPLNWRDRFDKAGGDPRVICDYVAGMTDGYLLKTYERLFAPRMGSVFDRL